MSSRWLILMAMTLAGSCRRRDAEVSPAEIAGVYRCNLGTVSHELMLNANGTFTEVVHASLERKATYTGQWEAGTDKPVGGTMYAQLAPYHFEWPMHIPGAGTVGEWMPIVTRVGNQIALVISEGDGNYCLRNRD